MVVPLLYSCIHMIVLNKNMSPRKSQWKCMDITSKVFTLVIASLLCILILMHLGLTLPQNFRTNLVDTTRVMVKSVCNGTVFPVHINKENDWGQVDQDKTIFVISAYYEGERGRIFVTGAKPFHEVGVICQFWFTTSNSTTRSVHQTRAKVGAPIGARGYNYTSTIFECKLESAERPSHVSLVLNSCENPLNLLQVREASTPVRYKRRHTVCLSPMFNFNEVFRLVEWIELNKILGAEKFLLYNYSTGVNIEKVINHYMASGVAEVIQWTIPFPPNHNIEYYAQKAALNDCIFRNRHFSEFIVNIDKDEYIIPHSDDILNWSQMLEQFDKNYAGYLVRHTFFNTDWKIKTQNFSERLFADSLHLVTLTHFEHEKKIWPATYRSKYFARTAYVDFGNIHEIPRGRIFTVPTENALLHHYRHVSMPKPEERIKDFTVLIKYGDVLTKNVQGVWRKLSV